MNNIVIAGQKVEVYEYQTDDSERSRFGVSVYMFSPTCRMWEYYMPSGTIRVKAYRDVENLWGAFIRDDRAMLSQFINTLSTATGYNMHLANKSSIPNSVYTRLSKFGLAKYYGDGRGDCGIKLIFYANNR